MMPAIGAIYIELHAFVLDFHCDGQVFDRDFHVSLLGSMVLNRDASAKNRHRSASCVMEPKSTDLEFTLLKAPQRKASAFSTKARPSCPAVATGVDDDHATWHIQASDGLSERSGPFARLDGK
jgi:hypothetical protein